MAVDIDSLQIEIEATSSDAASKIEQLATALTNLKSVAKGGAGLTTTTKQLQALSNAAKLINGTNLDSQKIQKFASAMNSLANIQKASGLSSTINALKKLPDISIALDKADLGKFAQQMNQVASAMRPLATEMQKVANGFSAFPIRIQKIIQSNTGLTASNNKTAKSFGVLGTGISSTHVKLGVYLIALRQIASAMSNWVKESNDYVENLNLFTVAMGNYAAEAKTYAEEVQAIMGIDSSEWMRNQGVFMQMASGFGVASDSAALMSKNLTQLGYDISSFYNISIEEAMQKLQSGMAGEIEPLRRLGYAIDVATLQQVALNHGITESVNSMSQAEKSQLRYIAIMEQSTNAMGDLSRTIQTPANAMRILNQQITQLSRALGNLLIPFLQTVIPWVQAFVEVLTDAINALARLVGFELPTIDYSGTDGVTSGATDVEDAITGATDAAKEMKRELLGIDELTILEPPSTGGTAGVTGGVSNGDLGLELPEYDFLGDLTTQTDELKRIIEPIMETVISIGATLLGWKLATSFIDALQNAGKILGNMKANAENLKKGLGTLSISAGLVLGIDNISSVLTGKYKNASPQSFIKTGLSGVLTGLGLVALGVTGWAIPVAAALAFAITDLIVNWKDFTTLWGQELDAAVSLLSGDIPGFWDAVNAAFLTGLKMDSFTMGIVRAILGDELVDSAISYMESGGTLQEIAGKFGQILLEKLQGVGTSISTFFSNLGSGIVSFFSPVIEFFTGFGTTVGGIFSSLWSGIQNIWNTVATWFQTYVIDPTVFYFQNATDTIGKIFSGVWITIQAVWTVVSSWFQDNVLTPLVEFFKGAINTISGFFSWLWDGIKGIWSTVSNWFSTNVIDPIVGFFKGAADTISEFFSNLWGGIKEVWTSVSTWFSENVINPVVGFFSNAVDAISGFFTGLWNGIKSGVASAMNVVIGGIEGAINFIVSGINKIIGGFNSVVNWAADIIGANWNSVPKLQKVYLGRISVNNYANGGFPDYGEMFIAREDGPELVGRIGNRSAVANNDQIIEGIASANDGVINAIYAMAQRIVTAIEENGGDIYVEADGTATQNRRNRMYGKTLQYI